ncbi:hypothetical protein [Leptolyngbya sp. PCC 6406]|uniref:hypothetical protein n=1 Tax=Leptolyngbya sp. PCC 6406 TaxID=1173264 RepID=UPI0002ABB902|nr:hypothetical protein [Leptolyngbya sp. PCC 6406]
MEESQVIQLSAISGWIIGVSHIKDQGYQCWVINADLHVLSNGTLYRTSSAALTAGRSFVERYT